jgi:phosphinothricin acetyltransferase
MARLEEIARAQGIHVLIGGVSGENPGAIAFHEAIGFDRVGHLPQVGHKFGKWLDLVLLQKTL